MIYAYYHVNYMLSIKRFNLNAMKEEELEIEH